MKKKEMWKTFCVDAATGKSLWNVAGGNNASPVVSGDQLVVFYYETGLKIYEMKPEAATEVGTATLESDDNLSCTPAVKDGKVFGFASKEGFCYDIKKKDFAWKITVQGKACSPLLADGKLIQFVGSALRMFDPATGKDLGPAKGAKVDIVRHSSPALADGKLLVNAGTHLRCYDLAKH
jgi:outer membrane protein assembly factor BamB